jgi:serine/threonine-protein kinase
LDPAEGAPEGREASTPRRPGVTRVGPYRLVRALGHGAFGDVYSAEDRILGRLVALKVLRAQLHPQFRRRIVQEARAAARLQHPFIATFYESGESAGRSYIAMELVDGATLRRRLDAGPLEVSEALNLVAGLLEALGHAHAAGVLHRDIKPENVMVTARGPKLLDFGLARVAPLAAAETGKEPVSRLTDARQILGTVGYMSPEQLRGDPADVRSDLFSLAAVLYEMIAGKPAFPAHHVAAVLSQDPPKLTRPGIPEGLEELIQKALACDPADRFPTATAFLRDLHDVSEGQATTHPPGSVAVMDFENLTRSPDAEWLGSGIAESLTTDLAGVDGLTVISREKVLRATSVVLTSRASHDSGEIGRLLGCRWVLSGSFQSVGRVLRVTAHIIETSTGRTLSDKKVDGTLETVFGLQDELATFVKDSLLSATQPNRRAPAAHVDVFELYARGRRLFMSLEKGSMRRGCELFERALEIDPDYVPALAGMTGYHAMAYTHSSDPAHLGLVNEFASRALAKESQNVDVHTWLGYALLRQGKPKEALEHERAAMELDPSHARSRYMGALCTWDLGRVEEALGLARQAVESDPGSSYFWYLLGWLHLELGRTDEAIWSLERAVRASQEDAQSAPGLFAGILGECLRRAGRHAEARQRCLEGLELIERTDHMHRDLFRVTCLLTLGRVSLDEQNPSAARAALGQAETQTRERTVGVGVGHARVQALAGLARAAQDRRLLAAALALFEDRRGYDFGLAPMFSDGSSLVQLAETAKALHLPEEAEELARRLEAHRALSN